MLSYLDFHDPLEVRCEVVLPVFLWSSGSQVWGCLTCISLIFWKSGMRLSYLYLFDLLEVRYEVVLPVFLWSSGSQVWGCLTWWFFSISRSSYLEVRYEVVLLVSLWSSGSQVLGCLTCISSWSSGSQVWGCLTCISLIFWKSGMRLSYLYLFDLLEVRYEVVLPVFLFDLLESGMMLSYLDFFGSWGSLPCISLKSGIRLSYLVDV